MEEQEERLYGGKDRSFWVEHQSSAPWHEAQCTPPPPPVVWPPVSCPTGRLYEDTVRDALERPSTVVSQLLPLIRARRWHDMWPRQPQAPPPLPAVVHQLPLIMNSAVDLTLDDGDDVESTAASRVPLSPGVVEDHQRRQQLENRRRFNAQTLCQGLGLNEQERDQLLVQAMSVEQKLEEVRRRRLYDLPFDAPLPRPRGGRDPHADSVASQGEDDDEDDPWDELDDLGLRPVMFECD